MTTYIIAYDPDARPPVPSFLAGPFASDAEADAVAEAVRTRCIAEHPRKARWQFAVVSGVPQARKTPYGVTP